MYRCILMKWKPNFFTVKLVDMSKLKCSSGENFPHLPVTVRKNSPTCPSLNQRGKL
jgi:hypothetical protein